MTLYGLFGFTHGWGRILTVMSPEGATRVAEVVEAGEGVIVEAAPGQLTRYFEQRAGALERLIAENGIVMLEKSEWDARKSEAGEAIWR
ncbi:MAG: hypothetical protein MI920_08540 [Kiloniellales bacterium]|nr:hypothetical protein [Kiloniellales bacterium]